MSSGERISRGGFLTTDPRNNVANASNGLGASCRFGGGGCRPDTDLYYSTDKSSRDDLMEQAMSIHRRKKNMQTNQTSPRQMLLTAAAASQETDSQGRYPN